MLHASFGKLLIVGAVATLPSLAPPQGKVDTPKQTVVSSEAKPDTPKPPEAKPDNYCALQNVPYNYAQYICTGAKKFGADPAVVAAIIYYEHRGFETDPLSYEWRRLCSHAGACGAAQFIAPTWKAYGVDGQQIIGGDGGGDGVATRGHFSDDIHSASNYIGRMVQKGKRSMRDIAIEYNCGPSCRWNPETADYVRGVTAAYESFRR